MSVRENLSQMIKEGKSPSEIAKELGKNPEEVKRLLLLQVGEQELRLSDILFTIPTDKRDVFMEIYGRYPDNPRSRYSSAIRRKLDPSELELYIVSRNAYRGDLYVVIADLEILLHSKIREILVSEFGENEEGWWRKGVPSEIRKRCAAMREEDPFWMDDAYSYTNIIDLWRIMDSQWSLFSSVLPSHLVSNKKEIGENMRKFNHLRNAIMHPVKGNEFNKEDLSFVDNLKSKFELSNWLA